MKGVGKLQDVLRGRSDIRLAYLFGSTAHGRQRPSSDVDIGVLFASQPTPATLDGLAAELASAARQSVDLVNLGTAPPLLAHEIVSQGKILVCRDDEERARFEARVIARYLDTAHLREVQYGYLRDRIEARRATSS
ncbi:MAG TPA: nucleotidyltransferase domain-containing protein [Vicinamibacteria bacterium]|nr:nucleotidyltransferase domain-containing protein [Vicinamibacteria bacterium]